MKLSIDIRVAKDWNETPVHVEVGEEVVGGDFLDQSGAETMAKAVDLLAAEAVAKAKAQIDRRLAAELAKQLADARATAQLEEVR